MRNTGSQQADRGHLFRNLKLLFELDAPCDVLDDHDRADGGLNAPFSRPERHDREVDDHRRCRGAGLDGEADAREQGPRDYRVARL